MRSSVDGGARDGTASPPSPSVTCCACLDAVDAREDPAVAQLGCGHRMHTRCLAGWMRCSRRCPLCQRDVITGEDRREADSDEEDEEDETTSSSDEDDDDDDDDGNEMMARIVLEATSSSDPRPMDVTFRLDLTRRAALAAAGVVAASLAVAIGAVRVLAS